MRNIEYSPFNDINVPYIDYWGARRLPFSSVVMESFRPKPMSLVTRYILLRELLLQGLL